MFGTEIYVRFIGLLVRAIYFLSMDVFISIFIIVTIIIIMFIIDLNIFCKNKYDVLKP